ncbi:MAG: GAF domain-containing protein [candidate division WOR-3 bacterium]
MQLNKKLDLLKNNESLDELLKKILDLSQEVLHSKAATLFLVDRTNNELVFKIVNGPTSKDLEGKRIKIGEGIAGKVAKEGRTLIVNRAKDSGYANKFDKQTGFTTESLLATPLIVDGEIIGVIEMVNSKRGFYTEESKKIIEKFAEQVSSELKLALLGERLLKTQDFLGSIINSFPGGLIILDEEGFIRKVNPQAKRIFKIKDVKGKKLEEILPYPRIINNIKKIKGKGSFEALIRRDNKDFHYDFEISTAKEITPSGVEKKYLVINIIDITEKIELNRLRYLQEVNANFISGLSHSLRTPLTPILGLSSILKDQPLGENHRKMLEVIYQSAVEMKEIVEKLLDIAEIGTRKVMKPFKEIDIISLLERIILKIDSPYFDFIPEKEKILIYGDYNWLEKCLAQLLILEMKNRKEKRLRLEVREEKNYVYLNFKGAKALIKDFSLLKNIPIIHFNDSLKVESEINCLEVPLIKLILNYHNVKIIMNEKASLFSLRFKK